jgi:mono/diheme cytochrome c family protein
MNRKHILALLLTIALLASVTVLAAAQSLGGGINQSGMDMGTATPQPTDMAPQPGDTLTQPAAQPHIVPLPAEYATYINTAPADSTSISRGAGLYSANCAQCHGATGLGDGTAGAALNPRPAAIAYTSQMLSDTYLFYRISEGGVSAPFSSAMPASKATLSETDRWDLVNAIRSLSNTAGAQAGLTGGCGMTGTGTIGAGMPMSGTTAMGTGCVIGTGSVTSTVGMGSMSGMSGMSTGCSMMSGSAMTGTTGMGSMSGMTGMGSMSGMTSMGSMSGMTGMTMPDSNMQGADMSGMVMPGMTTSGGLAEVEAAPWYSNPWTLLGWLLLALVGLAVLASLVILAVYLLRRSRPLPPPAT